MQAVRKHDHSVAGSSCLDRPDIASMGMLRSRPLE